MGVDCSMLLKCDFRDKRDHRKKVEYMRAFIDRMVEECRIPFKKNIVELVDEENYCFWFTPFALVSTNLYDGFWECESAWRFTQYKMACLPLFIHVYLYQLLTDAKSANQQIINGL